MSNGKVLIIDQNKSTSTTFRRILKRRGFEVDEICDNTIASDKIMINCYDVVVISLEDEDVNGKDILFFAKKNLPNAGKIVTIGFPSLENSIKALESGADAVLSKPIAPEDLINLIEKLTRK